MLQQFIVSHRAELLQDCKEKVATRFAPDPIPPTLDQGLSVFMDQLISALATRPTATPKNGETGEQIPFSAEIGNAAAVHGADLLLSGFTIDQVVHEYGDACQAITELAVELGEDIGADDFRILNGCIDNAIAGAVTSYVDASQVAINDIADERSDRLSSLKDAHRRLVAVAIQSFAAIKTGNVGMTGATGALLMHALTELQSLSDVPLGDEPKNGAAKRTTARP